MLNSATLEVAPLARRTVLRLGIAAVAGPARRPVRAAANSELRAITAGDVLAVQPILEKMLQRYKGLVHSTHPAELAQRRGSGIYLAIGPAALSAALDSTIHGPIVCLFTSSQTYNRIIAGAGEIEKSKRLTAIYAEASPEDQLQLASTIFQRRIEIGVMLTEVTAHLEPLLKRAARRFNIDLLVRPVPPNANPVRELNHLASANAILALPDSNIFNSQHLRGLLESTYRRSQPVIGFSTSLVDAGTLATAYSTVEDVLAHMDDLSGAMEQGRLPEPQYPAYWQVHINNQVARSLNIVVAGSVRALGNRPKSR